MFPIVLRRQNVKKQQNKKKEESRLCQVKDGRASNIMKKKNEKKKEIKRNIYKFWKS
jgi:hypothetical protein